MQYGWFAPVALRAGATWAARVWIVTLDPIYWAPSSTLDYAAVALYSAGLITLALCIWRLRVVHTPAVSRGGAAAALGLGTAGIANLVEDGLGLKPFGVVYAAGVLIGTLALLPLGIGLARAGRPPWLAAAALLTFPGLLLLSQWYGNAVLAGTWIAAAVLRLAGAFPLEPDDTRADRRNTTSTEILEPR
jgi:hypothetical protein